jgi:hypothetical protein
MIDLSEKPVNNRKTRPSWALDDRQLMLKCVGKRHALRFRIAQMYWQKNMTAQAIAEALNMKRNAVELILHRLSHS